MEMIESKKGMSGNTLGQVVTAVVVVIVASISAVILTSINAGQTAGSAAANVTRDGNTMLTNFSSLFGTYGTVLIAAALVAAVIGGLAYFGSQRR